VRCTGLSNMIQIQTLILKTKFVQCNMNTALLNTFPSLKYCHLKATIVPLVMRHWTFVGLCKWPSPSSQKEVGNLLTHPAVCSNIFLSSFLNKYITFTYLIWANQNEQHGTSVNHSETGWLLINHCNLPSEIYITMCYRHLSQSKVFQNLHCLML
jgi:hypothetical protein